MARAYAVRLRTQTQTHTRSRARVYDLRGRSCRKLRLPVRVRVQARRYLLCAFTEIIRVFEDGRKG